MKKLILLGFISVLSSCNNQPLKPIEKYQDRGFIITNIVSFGNNNNLITLKNKDTIMDVTVLKFDVRNLEIGDSLISSRHTYKSSISTCNEQVHNKNQ